MSAPALALKSGGLRSGARARRVWRNVLRVKLALVDRRKYERVVLESIGDVSLVVLPDVFNPKLLRSGEFLVSQARQVRGRVLDLGSGSGACGIAAARNGCSVVAVDINPSAVRCTHINALLNNVRVDVRQGDLFAPVANERFDVVLFNPPYYRGAPRDHLDHAWRSPDMAERFASELQSHLTDGGCAYVVLSSDGDCAQFLEAFQREGLQSDTAARRDFVNEIMSIYRVQPAC